ncbi:DNA-binding protein RHL1-like isoform X1 [Salvia splendens]|uniref:DNA-binding protein RHL1-like isoform X1 n=1 Tax=Salvia splendens TaxID=180675 RepID=UPI001C274874|nr:DNA-binding protein RHL1-like isoform X1 [Salvia splendens]XP_042018318.1 DNA-binding protein RHL1-like isoform X1 [Salvia splendens]XP_042018319.1 DNA-binding protein RHL1-like isoform X1 [Salvia splendens]
MVRGGKKSAATATAAADPEAGERSRLKKLAFSRSILSPDVVKVASSAARAPSKTVIKHHGCDILRKSQRKNKYLFSFPGLLGPVSGGKIGELKDLATKNPILYLDFPQGRMKLFGTIVYPKNRYLTLQFSKSGKNVTCDDYFENMVVFSDAWWIGMKEMNPEELQLEFPKELNPEKHEKVDFKGGVGVTSDCKQGSVKLAKKILEREPEKDYLEDELTDSPDDYRELTELTPTRQSARTAGKTFKFAESSGNGDETPEEEDTKVDNETKRVYTSTKTENCSPVFEGDSNDGRKDPASCRYKRTGKAKDPSENQRTPLVQTTLSSLFKKVEDKKEKKDAEGNTNTSEASKPIKGRKKIGGRKSETTATASKDQKKQHKVDEDDEIEEFSSSPEDMGESDEDWTV